LGRLPEALEQWRVVAASMPENAAVQQRFRALEKRVK
jgi:hypothetical protein